MYRPNFFGIFMINEHTRQTMFIIFCFCQDRTLAAHAHAGLKRQHMRSEGQGCGCPTTSLASQPRSSRAVRMALRVSPYRRLAEPRISRYRPNASLRTLQGTGLVLPQSFARRQVPWRVSDEAGRQADRQTDARRMKGVLDVRGLWKHF